MRKHTKNNKAEKLLLFSKFSKGVITIKSLIITATLEDFDENGIRFTMDDFANRMRVSKRTL